MKYLFLCALFCAYATCSLSQKPLIDSSVYGKWPSVEGAAISNDGNYTLYFIENQPVGSRTLIIQAIHGNWRMKIPVIESQTASFTQDSRRCIFLKPKDSLGIIVLGGDLVEYISHVSSFKLPKNNSGKWLAYQLNVPERELALCNLETGNRKSYIGVTNYLFSEEGKVLLLQIESKRESPISQSLGWVNLDDDDMVTIWKGTNVSNIVFDASSTQLAFTVENTTNSQRETNLWYYKAGECRAIQMTNNYLTSLKDSLVLDYIQGFSKDGNSLFLGLKERDGPELKSDVVRVDVWSYTDSKLQSQQLKEVNRPRSYIGVLHFIDNQTIRLEQENERLWQSAFDDRTDNVVLIEHRKGEGGEGEENWNTVFDETVYLVYTKNGARKQIKELKRFLVNDFKLSPDEKYVIFYDAKEKNYFSYEIISGVTRNITRGIFVSWMGYRLSDLPNSFLSARGIAGWLKEDAAIFIYDEHDIWEVDPQGKRPPVNLTNGYGGRHNIIFDLAMDYSHKAIADKENLILSAFNRSSKENGFYSKIVTEKGDPILLSMGHCFYNVPSGYVPDLSNFSPIMAVLAKTYIVRRMSATESPNYFFTADFRTFTPLSDLHPEKEYNWLTTELVNWKTMDGTMAQGVLYKPENFDPKKKYPIIFYYYEVLSDGLNAYVKPEASDGRLNICWFVSNGYLVFTPDIRFKIGTPGESVVNSVVSAANYLSKMPWVDGKKMGIQGMSFGGIATNYLVTHTRLFAAACSSSGVFDFISGYGSLMEGGGSLQGIYELTQTRIGASLWQRPDLYIKNSPIFRADQVTTPFLMMHTKNDGVCPFVNAVEFFTALRRLGKKAWMLQYDDGNHGVSGKSADDFSIRMAQFFDHYLKGTAAPKWMTQGVPAKMKGIETGLGLEKTGKEP